MSLSELKWRLSKISLYYQKVDEFHNKSIQGKLVLSIVKGIKQQRKNRASRLSSIRYIRLGDKEQEKGYVSVALL